MKSHIRWSKASGSTKRKVEQIALLWEKESRRRPSTGRRDRIVASNDENGGAL